MSLQLRVIKAKKTAASSNAARKGAANQSGSDGGNQGLPGGLDRQTFEEIQELSDQVSRHDLYGTLRAL